MTKAKTIRFTPPGYDVPHTFTYEYAVLTWDPFVQVEITEVQSLTGEPYPISEIPQDVLDYEEQEIEAWFQEEMNDIVNGRYYGADF